MGLQPVGKAGRQIDGALDTLLEYRWRMDRARKRLQMLRSKVSYIGPQVTGVIDELLTVLDYEHERKGKSPENLGTGDREHV